jgi:UPF0755 protein
MASKLVLTPEELSAFLKKEKFGFLLMGACLLLPFVVWVGWVFAEMNRQIILNEPKTITIEKNAGFFQVMDILSQNSISRSAPLKLYLLSTGRAGKIQTGTYVFKGELSSIQVAHQLIRGPEDITVTIPEGYTVFDIDKRLSQAGLITSGELIAMAKHPELFDFEFLRSDEISSLEGFLFPDTYRFSQFMEVKDMVWKMLANFEKKAIRAMGSKISENPAALYPTLKVASLIEKEVPRKLDRALVSDILWKRLEIGMPLQVDASVVYALRLQNPDWQPQDHALSLSDLKIKSLYNTYKYKDLPPTPVSNPGLESIEAALYPERSQYFYYLSTKDGLTIFSETLEQHNAAKSKYLK